MRAVTVDRVGMDVERDQAVLILKDAETNRVLPIWIGLMEATAIALKLQEQVPPRPLTVDLLKTVLDTFDARVLMIVINDIKDHAFTARIFLQASSTGASTIEFDARPSDAIGLALRTGAPIYVAEWILEESGMDAIDDDDDEDLELDEDEDGPRH